MMMTDAVTFILSFIAALVVHEMGHFFAARACRIPSPEVGLGWGRKLTGIRLRGVEYCLRLLPFGAYVRLDMATLQVRPVGQQLLVLLAGVAFNLCCGVAAWGTVFGKLSLMLALANLLPIYQQDGWKAGIVLSRRLFARPSPVVEWSFTLSGGFVALVHAQTIFSACW